MQKNKRFFSVFLYLILSSVLFSFSFPGFVFESGFPLFAWFCFIPLFFALERMETEFSFLYGFFFGLVSYSFLVYWLYKYSPFIFFLAVVFYAICYGILFMFLKLPLLVFQKTGWIIQCLILISFEYIKTLGFLGFSYGVTGYTQYKCTPLIKIADITGVYGVSFLVIFCSGICFSIFRFIFLNHDLKRRIRYESHNSNYTPVQFEIELAGLKERAGFRVFVISAAVFLFVLIIVFAYGVFSRSDVSSYDSVEICAVQHNENPREDGVNIYAENITLLTRLTDDALSLYPETKIVVWPETAVTPSIMYQFYNGKDSRRISIVNSLLKYFDARNCTFVIGNYHREEDTGNRETKDFNSALVFTPGKNVLPPEPEMYFKQKLVPLSEEFPFENHFLNLKQIMINLGASFWCKGNESKIFESSGLKFSIPICFEDTFPHVCRDMAQKGSLCFINLTNDSWGESIACQNQHLSMAVFRSVENNVPTVRSATSGQTCVIYPDGKIMKEAAPFSASFIVHQVPLMPSSKGTFYTRFGDVFAYVILSVTGVLLIITVIKGIINLWQNRY
ncbi:MAG: apolipoprotein N-acyltransferase [Treponema sp.]|nr:apolipoprotein N-acyltransferase [Treponema sp.]